MYDGVTLQNNYNIGNVPPVSYYQNGAGVFIRTAADIQERQAEFIMKGGTIRGNINDIQTPLACGGGVFIAGHGLFTMEGGAIMNNTARGSGGGFHVGGRGAFKKTGGVVYGKNAPAGLRNTALEGNAIIVTTPRTRGHAICVAADNPVFWFRNDTVMENDILTFTGTPHGTDTKFGIGENWDNSDKAFRRWLFTVVIPPVLVFGILVFLILRMVWKKQLEASLRVAGSAPEIDLDGYNLTEREKEICKLLLTKLNFKEIAAVLNLSKAGVKFHSQNLYRKLGIQSRTELFVKLGQQ